MDDLLTFTLAASRLAPLRDRVDARAAISEFLNRYAGHGNLHSSSNVSRNYVP